jgi:hypothetical protein
MLRGAPGTAVTVTFERDSSEPSPWADSSVCTLLRVILSDSVCIEQSSETRRRKISSGATTEEHTNHRCKIQFQTVVRYNAYTVHTNSTTTCITQTVLRSQVKLTTFLGDPEKPVGYIDLAGFNSGAGNATATTIPV